MAEVSFREVNDPLVKGFPTAHILAGTNPKTTGNMMFAMLFIVCVLTTVLQHTACARWVGENGSTRLANHRKIEYLPKTTRIVNGKRAKEYLSFGVCAGDQLCGGTLIHDDLFLTAARKCN
jgi:hypothetical protein